VPRWPQGTQLPEDYNTLTVHHDLQPRCHQPTCCHRSQRVQLQPHQLIPVFSELNETGGARPGGTSGAACLRRTKDKIRHCRGSKGAATGWRRTPDPVADGEGLKAAAEGGAGAEGEDSPRRRRRDWEKREMQPCSLEFTLKLPIEP
jgi:hypothetical protein